ncbi:hypothetical protein KM043_013054 [Ampulex compressa]|nr:hypothetical protein KM043_013054 [Ampulex compressa]
MSDIVKVEEPKQNIEKLMEDLRFLVKSESQDDDNDVANILRILDTGLYGVDISEYYTGETGELSVNEVFAKLLKHKSKQVVAKTAKAIAVIATCEGGRQKCTTMDLISILMNLLKEDDIDVLTQVSRALGNICYENESGKKLVTDKDGLKLILAVLKKAISLKNVEDTCFLRDVAAGFLLNFLVDRPQIYKEVLEEGTVPIICSVLEIDGIMDSEAAMPALLILGILSDANFTLLDERLVKILVNILESDISLELFEIALELLHGQAKDENAQLLLAKSGICELLLKLLEKHSQHCTDEETKSVLKVACNLIVLILTGDESMNVLYDKSNGPVYKKLLDWLGSSDEDLRITAVLAMGNFARSDLHCKHMVMQGVHKQLLTLLQKNYEKTDDIRFQHALLSALRNLVIPADNKQIVLQDGLIDTLYPMLDIPTFPVVFKLLGTLRIVINGQREAAISLGSKDDFIKRIVSWCNIKDHPGVRGEAKRLIARLINNSRDREIALLVIKHGAVKHLVKMIKSRHVLMQNEALRGLTIVTTICLKESEEVLINANIGQNMYTFLKESGCNLELPIIHNAFTFIDSMIKSDVLKEHLKKCGLVNSCERILEERGSDAELKEQIETVCKQIETDLNLKRIKER